MQEKLEIIKYWLSLQHEFVENMKRNETQMQIETWKKLTENDFEQ